ncbi:MAG: tetratricopeptide repeat protein [Spirochaetota bacterium]|nr:tetratricopeptide repeat protein [Spirochaetota bacterium]
MSLDYNFTHIDNFIGIGRYDEAITELNRILAVEPGDTEALWRIGVCFTEKNDPVKAMKALDYFFKFVQDHPQALEARGCAFFKLGDYQQAREYLEQAEELQPDSSSIKRNLGVVYNQIGMKKEGYERFKASYALNPADYRTEYALAMAHINFDEFDEAQKILLQMLSQQIPDDFRELVDESYQWVKRKLARQNSGE